MRHPFQAQITVELAEQRVAVFLCPLGEVLDEILDLFARGFPKRFHRAEVGRVGFDQIGIELMLADDLAEAIPDSTAGSVPVSRLWRKLL